MTASGTKTPGKPSVDEAAGVEAAGVEAAGGDEYAAALQRKFQQENPVVDDRTEKQPMVFTCTNPACREFDAQTSIFKKFDFESDLAVCPKCGAGPPIVHRRTLIHLIARNDQGPIVGQGGLRWFMLCDPRRTYLATTTNEEAATGDSTVANCPGCLKVLGNRVVVSGKPLGM